ncbi:LOW QUALITY PROTEIN: hypothetical protein KUTeg_010401 [Tegillarca granosa]|uniref:DZIP3-like HEPN domain-containing protein n=1 Tax=Tegillarca granosa TaxID=220873 RepID=A0ABQ9F6L7_TEGGR|nr:LOW QUALITY PROTEIN: hypothetical protein KUTeg_010401 [Tegillarca granosa]
MAYAYPSKITPEMKKQLNEGTEPDYKNFDISFIYLLLRTPGMCRPPIPVPTNRWGTPPSTKYQVTLGDDIERLRILKNHICSHIKKPEVSKQEFDDKISELKDIAQRIDTFLAPSSAYFTEKMENFSSEITAQKVQEKAFIKQISQDDELFVETNSFKKILSLIDLISVIGNTGQGKTALSRHAAIYLYNKGYKIFNIRSADEFRRKFNLEIRALYLLDDIFGKHYKIQHEVDSWFRMDDEVTNWLKESDIYLISTSQKIVWNECQPYIKTCELFQKENILDLTLEELHPFEKREILRKHLLAHNRNISERLLQKIIQIETPIGFPFCCSSFSSNDELYALEHEYFLNTKASLKKEFERLSEINIEKFCALLSVMVLGNSLPDSFENIFETAVGDKVSSVLLPYGIELNKNIVKLNRALTDLKGVYLQEHNHKVSFTHDAYIDAMCMVVNKSNIDVILRNCTADFFHQYIRISEELGQTDNDTPTFLTDPDEDLFNCIFRLLKSGELHLVFENPMFGNENFMNRFTKQVCKEPELFGLIACPLENDNDKPSKRQ